uniref:Large ribosomal subunit protein uL30m n=1 Tax=Daphnia carinata TaxID=120202 RepID=A0A4Y7M2U2_9CRUS|nr:EOG090X0EYV [Daphnia carinata]
MAQKLFSLFQHRDWFYGDNKKVNWCLWGDIVECQAHVIPVDDFSRDGPINDFAEYGFTEDGGQRFHGFTYYPRLPGQQDPPYEPSKVLMVERIRVLKHRPYWEKDVLTKLGLPMTVKSSQAVIVANTPSICAQLWKVKHLIRVTPITFPQGLPEDGDAAGARLQDNGELVFIPKLKSDALMAATQSKPEDRRDYLDTDTVKKHLRLKWLMPY